MSYYDDERSRRRSTRERGRDSYDDTSYDTRGDNRSLVRRRDDSASSVEEVTRDFPPGERGGGYYRETTVRKQGHRPVGRSFGDSYYENDRRDDRSGYSKRRSGRDDDTYVSRRRSGYTDSSECRHRHSSMEGPTNVQFRPPFPTLFIIL